MKKNYSWIALLFGAAVFAGVLYSLGPSEIWRAFSEAHIGYVGLTSVFFVLPTLLRLYKWKLMRDRMGASISLSEMNGIYFSSKFWGMVSPMRSGEVAPAIFRGDQRGKLLSIILYDRVLETFQSLAVFAALFVILYEMFFNAKVGYALAGLTLILAAFTFALFSRKAGRLMMDGAVRVLGALGGFRPAAALARRIKGLEGDMEEFYDATKTYFHPGFALFILFLTFAGWALDIAFWVVLFRAFNIDTGIYVTAMAVMVYSMMAAIAPTPNGLGLSDLSFALVLGQFGYKGEVGGLIIASRILVTGYVFLGYLIFSMPRLGRQT